MAAQKVSVEELQNDERFKGMTRDERVEARIVELEKKVFNGLSNLPNRLWWIIGILLAVLMTTGGMLITDAGSRGEQRATLRAIERQVDRIEKRMESRLEVEDGQSVLHTW